MIDAPLAPVLRRARILERVQRDGAASISELASARRAEFRTAGVKLMVT